MTLSFQAAAGAVKRRGILAPLDRYPRGSDTEIRIDSSSLSHGMQVEFANPGGNVEADLPL
jgi:hypothetical protein